MEIVNTEGLYASYGKKEILRDITLSVKKGEIVAVIGPNGAGKSTLLKALSGILKPVAGKIWLDGKEISALPSYERARLGIGYCLQGGKVFNSLTVMENLETGASILPTGKMVAIEQALEFFPTLKGFVEKRAGLLSGGERQALSIAMTLVRQPKVLLLDEPSAGLSPRLVHDILGKIGEINKTQGITILLVEQNVKEALGIAGRVVVLANGRIEMQSEQPKELLDSSILEKIFIGRNFEDKRPFA